MEGEGGQQGKDGGQREEEIQKFESPQAPGIFRGRPASGPLLLPIDLSRLDV